VPSASSYSPERKWNNQGYKRETEQKYEKIGYRRADMVTAVPDPNSQISILKVTELDRSRSQLLNWEMMKGAESNEPDISGTLQLTVRKWPWPFKCPDLGNGP
jgi:hypothetical protein